MKAERGTWAWFRWRVSSALIRKRLPAWLGLGALAFFVFSAPYRWYLRALTTYRLRIAGPPHFNKRRKCLFAVPVGDAGKPFLEKIIRKFGHENFDYLVFLWEGTDLSEDVFKKCRIIREPGIKWYFLKKYLTPAVCAPYDYVFTWDDDIEVDDFSVERFLDIMEHNHLELAQPALTRDSYHIHGMVLGRTGKVGRYTDFVEIMVPVFKKDAWVKYWNILEPDWNYWGWGYDDMANSLCGYRFTGIIDCELVRHAKICRKNPEAKKECDLFVAKHKGAWRALKVSYAPLKDLT